MAVFGSASVSYCQAVWHLKTAGWTKKQLLPPHIPLFHSLHALDFRDSLLSVWSLSSETGGVCLYQPAAFKQNLPLCLQEVSSSFPELLLWPHSVVSRRRITAGLTRKPKSKALIWNSRLIGSLGSAASPNKESSSCWLSNLMAICRLGGKNGADHPFKAKHNEIQHTSVIKLAPFWLRNTVHKTYTLACLRVIVCRRVAQHLTEALIATTNRDDVCSERRGAEAPPPPLRTHRICCLCLCLGYLLYIHLLLPVVRPWTGNKDLTTHLRSYCK